MNSEVKKLFELKRAFINLHDYQNVLEMHKKEVAEYEQILNNPAPFALKKGKPTNVREELEDEFRSYIEDTHDIEDVSEILKGFFRHPFIKAGVLIGLCIIGIVIGEGIVQKMVAQNLALETDPAFEVAGMRTIVIVFFSLLALINVVPVIFNLIKRVINVSKINNMKFSSKQLKQLQEAEQTDKENKKYNEELAKKQKPEFEKEQAKYIKEIKEQLEMKQQFILDEEKNIKKYTDLINKNDCLAPSEKNRDVVEMLAYFIETKRADSIKEALHEYDKIKFNAAQLAIEQEKVNVERAKMEAEQRDRRIKLEQERMHQAQVQSQIAQQTTAIDNIGREVWLNSKNH